MDRKGLIGVVVCIVLYFVLLQYFSAKYPQPVHRPAVAAGTNAPAANPAVVSNAPNPATHSATTEPVLSGPEKLDFLDNEYVRVTLTSRGAAIKSIELKKHSEGDKNIILNDDSHDSVMAVSGWPEATFEEQATPTSVAYTATLPDGVKWTRTFTLGKDYLITVADTLANGGASEAVLPPYSISVGRAKPLLVQSHWMKKQYQPFSSQYIGAGWLTTAAKYHLTTISAFEPTGFFTKTPGLNTISSATIDPNPLRWLGVQNQFFAVLLTPDEHHPIAQATFHAYNPRDADGKIPTAEPPDIEAFADFPELHLPTGQATTTASCRSRS
jgi:YidC/Oxa1 family membrane protein insertase